jgi:hypothetical protein
MKPQRAFKRSGTKRLCLELKAYIWLLINATVGQSKPSQADVLTSMQRFQNKK